MMKYVYTWINGLDGKRKKSTLERLRKESVRDHKNIRLSGEGGVGDAEGSAGQNYGFQAQTAIQGYVQNLAGGNGGGGSGGGHGSSHSHSSAFAPSYGSGSGGFPNIPGIPGQLPSLLGGPGFGKREGPGDVPPQPSPYASSYAPAEPLYGGGLDRSVLPEPRIDRPSPYASTYAPAEPSYGDGSYRSILPEPRVDQPSPYASSYAPSHPAPSEGGYQPSYDSPSRQFGFGGGTGGYGDVGDRIGGGFGYGEPPGPQPQTQNDGMDSNPWQGDRQFGYSGSFQRGNPGAPGFPNPQQGYGF